MNSRPKQASTKRPTDPKSGKAWTDMNASELRESTRVFDEPLVIDRESRDMSRAELAAYRRAIRSNGTRTSVARRVTIVVDSALLKKADAYARKRRMSRSELVARGLKALITSAA